MTIIGRTTAFACLQSASGVLHVADALLWFEPGPPSSLSPVGPTRTVTPLSGLQPNETEVTGHYIHPAFTPRGHLYPFTDLRSTGTAS